MRLSCYDYVVLLHPTDKELEDGKHSEKIIGGNVLAHDNNDAFMKVTTMIPSDKMSDTSRLEILIRPF